MKINIIDENNFIVFLNKHIYPKLDNQNLLEESYKDIFLKLKERYQFDVFGYYNITVYQDEFYGNILEITKEDISYFDTDIDMHLNIKKVPILYELEDILNYLDKKIYFYKNKYYLKLEKDISSIELGKILENSKITYGIKAEEILKFGKIITMR